MTLSSGIASILRRIWCGSSVDFGHSGRTENTPIAQSAYPIQLNDSQAYLAVWFYFVFGTVPL